MVKPKIYLDTLIDEGVSFFSGVPDSLLKNFCACITDNINDENHFIASNEGAAIGLAIGRHLGKGDMALVYLQNSGIGNIINPLLSLASPQVYGIPMLILIGWRGEPGIKDEPQHIHQGNVMIEMLKAMNIRYEILSNDSAECIKQTQNASNLAKKLLTPIVLIARKGIFEEYSISKNLSNKSITREEAIIESVNSIESNAAIVSTTGMASRELYEYRKEKTWAIIEIF